jgi:hypothetical protein
MRRFSGSGRENLNRNYAILFLSRVKMLSLRIAIASFAIGGSDPIHDLPLIAVKRNGEIYLTFSKGARPVVGEAYYIVRPIGSSEGVYLFPGRPRKIVAKVKILTITDDTRAQIEVLSGSVIGGVSAEKLT